MPLLPVESLSDPLLDPYRSIAQTNLTRWSGLFIAEGKLVVQRLLESRLETVSVLIPGDRETPIPDWIPTHIRTLVAPPELAKELVGYKFHNGILGAGRRPPGESLHELAHRLREQPKWTAVVCPNTTNPENLGSLIRLCAGFGVDFLLLGRGCCDPWSRRTLRISMGAAFRLSICETPDLDSDLERLHREHRCERLATVLDPTAEPLAAARRSDRIALLFGNEATGLGEAWMARCDRRVTIPMATGVDSLNIAVAAGIFLHHFTQSVGFAEAK